VFFQGTLFSNWVLFLSNLCLRGSYISLKTKFQTFYRPFIPLFRTQNEVSKYILITECEVCPGKYLPRPRSFTVQNERSEVCTKDRGQIFSRTDRTKEVIILRYLLHGFSFWSVKEKKRALLLVRNRLNTFPVLYGKLLDRFLANQRAGFGYWL